jgi:hypothetical protein
MRDIDPVGEYGLVLDADVEATLEGLYPGSRYAASDLYARYSDVVRSAGRNPGHPIALGQALKRLGSTPVKMTVGGGGSGHKGRGRQVSAWIISPTTTR